MKGQSGNPSGRPKVCKELETWARQLCDEKGRAALERIATRSRSADVRLRAWAMILDRAYGKPSQEVRHAGPDGDVLRIEVVYVSKTNGHG